VLLEVRIGERPSEGPFVSPVFWESGDPAQEESAWLKFAMRIRPYLERVVSLAPDSPEAERARVVLAGSAKGRPPVDSPAR
jgi:hypothetical protein